MERLKRSGTGTYRGTATGAAPDSGPQPAHSPLTGRAQLALPPDAAPSARPQPEAAADGPPLTQRKRRREEPAEGHDAKHAAPHAPPDAPQPDAGEIVARAQTLLAQAQALRGKANERPALPETSPAHQDAARLWLALNQLHEAVRELQHAPGEQAAARQQVLQAHAELADFMAPDLVALSDADALALWTDHTKDLGQQVSSARLEAATALAWRLGLCRRPPPMPSELLRARDEAVSKNTVRVDQRPDPLMVVLLAQAVEHASRGPGEGAGHGFPHALAHATQLVQHKGFWHGERPQRHDAFQRIVRLLAAAFSSAAAAGADPAQLVEGLVSSLVQANAVSSGLSAEATVTGAYVGLASDSKPELAAVWARALMAGPDPSFTRECLTAAFASRVSHRPEGRTDRLRAVLRALGEAPDQPGAAPLLRTLTSDGRYLEVPAQLHATMAELPFAVMHSIVVLASRTRWDIRPLADDLLTNTAAGAPTPSQRLQLATALVAAQDRRGAAGVRSAWTAPFAPGPAPHAGPGPAPGSHPAPAHQAICRGAAAIARAPSEALDKPLLTPPERLEILRTLLPHQLEADPGGALTIMADLDMRAETPLAALAALSILATVAAPRLRLEDLNAVYEAALERVREVDLSGEKPSGLARRASEPARPAADSKAKVPQVLGEVRSDLLEAATHLVTILESFRRLPEMAPLYNPPAGGAAPVDSGVLGAHLDWLNEQYDALGRPEVHDITRVEGRPIIDTLRQPLMAALERPFAPAGPGPQPDERALDA